MIKAILLVPILDNEGNPFPKEMFFEVEERLLMAFGGFTFAGVVKGAWLHENRIYQDKCRRYEIALSEETRQELIEIAQWIKLIERSLKWKQKLDKKRFLKNFKNFMLKLVNCIKKTSITQSLVIHSSGMTQS